MSNTLRIAAATAAFSSLLLTATHSLAETCWAYADGTNANAPIKCVSKADFVSACSWPSDCTLVPASSPQTINKMHETWHSCFGAVGGSTPPAGRGQRWYAFHRQFELDYDLWRRAIGIGPIESLDWCPNMNMPYGTDPVALAPGVHPLGCGTGTPRPDNTICPGCGALPQCVFVAGGGPIACTGAPSCTAGFGAFAVTFPYATLNEFTNVDDVSKLLDAQFHGDMHGAVADGDSPGTYNQDNQTPSCSARDGMFWRLHKALDDVVRAWQDVKAVDVVLVVDRSGSMSDPDPSGVSKLQAALAAVDNFADLMETSRTDGQTNRLGVVSYSNAATTNMPMTVADASLRAPGGALATAIAAINAAGPNGCTGMGVGLQRALELLCPPGDCSGFTGPGNARKAILLLTDGIENVSPCLQPSGPSGGTCGSQCFGPQFDYSKLQFTQLVAVGFGNAAALDGQKLTLLAERQGGIYLQNPGGTGDDLKHFFTKAFGQLTDEFTYLDPIGTLMAAEAATEPVEYQSCGDAKLTFASGWQQPIAPGELRLQVKAPNGSLVRRAMAGVEARNDRTWDFARIKLPQAAPVAGHWSAQIIRPHRVYVNGFTPDSFAAPRAGETLVRDEIHRLCPDGCKRVLLFEMGRRGATSAYERAVHEEDVAGLLGGVKSTTDPVDFRDALQAGRWDLVVYAYMGPEKDQPYDQILARVLCENQRAIVTDVRARFGGPAILRCAGALRDDTTNWTSFDGDGRLASDTFDLVNPGHAVFSYGVRPTSARSLVQASVAAGKSPAITAIVVPGKDARWYLDVLGSGLSRIDPVNRFIDVRAGDELFATARILPSFVPAGGFDSVDARVEVEYPRIGMGTLLSKNRKDQRRVRGELLDARMATASALSLPTGKATFPIYDDGTHGDLIPNNAYWTGRMHGIGATDGPYTLRFMFDLTKNGCTTHRELTSSMYVDVRPDPKHSVVKAWSPAVTASGIRTFVDITPADRFGNLLGPGRADVFSCSAGGACDIDPRSVVDFGDGRYRLAIDTPRVAGMRLMVAGGAFDLPLPCPECARLAGVKISAPRSFEHSTTVGEVRLDKPAPDGGALITLASASPAAATVPPSVLIPAGASQATFEVKVHHANEGPAIAAISAAYAGTQSQASVTVAPSAWKTSENQPARPATPHHHYPQEPKPPR